MAGRIELAKATEALKAAFERLLPGIAGSARFTLKVHGLRGEALAEAVQESTAMAFTAFLAEQAKPSTQCTSGSLGRYAALQCLSGRRAAGSVPAKDAMGIVGRMNNGHAVESIHETISGMVAKHESPADAAAFRVDAASWVEKLSERDRELVGQMAEGYTNDELAKRHRVTPARISQKRREFAQALVR